MKPHPDCVVIGCPIGLDESLPKLGLADFSGDHAPPRPSLSSDDYEEAIEVTSCGDCPFGHMGEFEIYVCRLAEVLGEREPEYAHDGDPIPNGCPLPPAGLALPVTRKS